MLDSNTIATHDVQSRHCSLTMANERWGMQAVAGREAAVQQVEEARLALRAAERAKGEMQSRLQQAQAQLPPPSSRRHCQQHEATARQLWAGPRSTAYASLAVSPVSRYALYPPICPSPCPPGPVTHSKNPSHMLPSKAHRLLH